MGFFFFLVVIYECFSHLSCLALFRGGSCDSYVLRHSMTLLYVIQILLRHCTWVHNRFSHEDGLKVTCFNSAWTATEILSFRSNFFDSTHFVFSQNRKFGLKTLALKKKIYANRRRWPFLQITPFKSSKTY